MCKYENIHRQTKQGILPGNTEPTSSKKTKIDPFEALQQVAPQIVQTTNIMVPRDEQCDIEMVLYLAGRENGDKTVYDVKNPLTYWKQRQRSEPILAEIATKIFVIQGSSGESKRHFSNAGAVITDRRSLLSPENAENLTVLKEAFVNNLWPSSD